LKTQQTFSDTALINLVKRKDEQACELLYHKYAAPVYGLITEIMPDRTLHDELLQEVFVKAVNNVYDFEPVNGRLFTWLMHITRQTCLEKLPGIPAEQAAEYIPERSTFSRLVNKIDHEDKEMVSLSWLKGYAVEEIAQNYGIPTETARTRLKLALVQLRTLL